MYSNGFRVGDVVKIISVDNRKYNKHIPICIGDTFRVIEQPNSDFPQDALQVSNGSACGALDSKILRKVQQ